MTLKEYKALLWQDQDEAYFDFCDANDLDHTEPESREMFFESLEAA